MRIPTGAIGVCAAAAAGLAACGADEPSESVFTRNIPLWQQLPDKPPGPRPPQVRGTARHFELEQIADGFQGPVQVVARPGEPGRLYVVEQPGRIRILERDGRIRPFHDLRDRVLARGEQGLLSLVFSPDGARAFVLYVDKRNHSKVVELPDRELLDVKQPHENHKGGTLLFDERGRLLVSLGDGGSAFDPDHRAQNPDDPLGKVLRRENGDWKVVATGLRNPWRMSFDRQTGRLWIGDVGQDRVEEVDAVYPSEEGTRVPNLGWPAYEGDLPLGRKPLAEGAQVEWPVAAYLHRDGLCSVTGGYVYRGRRIRALRGRYVYGDFCRGTIWSIRESGRDLRRETARLPGLTSFGEDAHGELYATSAQGTVHRLVAAD